MTRLLVAEDQGMMRGALVALLDLEHDLEVVAEVAAATRWSRPPSSTVPTWRCSTSRCPASTASTPPSRCGGRCPAAPS